MKEKLEQLYIDSEVLFLDGPKEIYPYFALFSRCSQTFHEVISFLYSFVTKMQEGDYDAKAKEQTKVFTYTFFIDVWVMDTLCLVRDCFGLCSRGFKNISQRLIDFGTVEGKELKLARKLCFESWFWLMKNNFKGFVNDGLRSKGIV